MVRIACITIAVCPKAVGPGEVYISNIKPLQIAADTRATSGPIVADKASRQFPGMDVPFPALGLHAATELRETPLHRTSDMVCRSRHGR